MDQEKEILNKEKVQEVAKKAQSKVAIALAEIFLNRPDKAHASHGIVTWNELPKRRKVGFIIGWICLALTMAFVLCVFFCPSFFGYTNTQILTGVATTDPSYFAITILRTVFYVFIIYASVRLFVWLLSTIFVHATKKTITIVRLVSSSVEYLCTLSLIFIILSIWGVDTTTILASAGIVALIVGLGAQSLIADVIGGLAIVFENQFDVGDIIVIDGFRGSVMEIGLTATRVVDGGGNCKVIKNSAISSVINLSHDYSLAVVDMLVDYEDDLDNIRSLLTANLPSIAKKIPQLNGPLSYLGVQEFQASGILLRIVGKVNETDKFAVQRQLNEAIYDLFIKNGISIPLHQIVVKTPAKKRK
jgi:small-conductance mechanosensitive channel